MRALLTLMLAILLPAMLLSQALAQETSEEKAKKRSDKIAKEQYFAKSIPANYLISGPYHVSIPRQGQTNQNGALGVTVEAADVPKRTLLANNQKAIDGILLPLAIDLYAKGRPTRFQVAAFKKEAMKRLDHRFPGHVTDLLINVIN